MILMSVNVRQFRAQFPEFADTAYNVIQRALADAALRINASVWGMKTDLGIKYLAAHLCVSGPLGEQARLKAENRTNNYHTEFERMKREVTVGFRYI